MLESNYDPITIFKDQNARLKHGCSTSLTSIGQCLKATAKLRGKNARVFSPSLQTAAQVVLVHRPVSSIARSRLACFGCRTKIIRPLDASRSIPTSVSAVRSALAKDPMEHFWMAVRGTRSRWCQPTIGSNFTESCYRIFRPHRQPANT